MARRQRSFRAQPRRAARVRRRCAGQPAAIIVAVRSGLSAADVAARTHGNVALLMLYAVFVLAVAVHAPIGLRNVLREWTAWRGRSLDITLGLFAVVLIVLGLRAAF